MYASHGEEERIISRAPRKAPTRLWHFGGRPFRKTSTRVYCTGLLHESTEVAHSTSLLRGFIARVRSKHPQQASAASIRSVRLAYIQGGSSRRRFRDFLCSVKTCHTANSPVVKPYCGKKLS
jgi:hypothetical protein